MATCPTVCSQVLLNAFLQFSFIIWAAVVVVQFVIWCQTAAFLHALSVSS